MRNRDAAAWRIGTFRDLETDETDEVTLESRALLRFLVPEIEESVRFTPQGLAKPTPGGVG